MEIVAVRINEDDKRYRRAADQKHAGGQYALGRMYETGRGVEQDDSEAARWYQRAADQKHADARHRLAVMYANGRGVEQNNRRAAWLFLDAAEQGHPRAQYEVGVSYETGRGAEQNEAESARWYRRAAERGHQSALKKVLEIERLETQLHGLAEEGDPSAQYELAIRYRSSDSKEKQAEAISWFRRAADDGDVRSEYMLGSIYDNASRSANGEENLDALDATEAVRWYRRAAEQGHAGAQTALGCLYTEGIGVSRDDTEAIRWFQRAAEQQDADGEYLLGCVYGEGRGIPRDDAEAIRWLRRAADQGHNDARYLLCNMCKDGRWVDAEAIEWLRWQGDEDAMYALGTMYRQGWGVRRSDAKAFEWFRRAAERGHYEAERELADRPSLPRRILGGVELLFGGAMFIGLALAFSLGFALLVNTGLDLLLPLAWTAVVECPDHVERLGNYGFRWTDGLWELKLRLSQTVVANDPDVVTYVGDRIEYQNGYGAWEPHVYECDLHATTRELVDVRAMPCRLPF